MAAELIDRVVKGPNKDWIDEVEVCALIVVSPRTLSRMIENGQFPRPVVWRGEARDRWRWVDVAWYILGREIAERLADENSGPPDDTDTPTPAKPKPTPAK